MGSRWRRFVEKEKQRARKYGPWSCAGPAMFGVVNLIQGFTRLDSAAGFFFIATSLVFLTGAAFLFRWSRTGPSAEVDKPAQ